MKRPRGHTGNNQAKRLICVCGRAIRYFEDTGFNQHDKVAEGKVRCLMSGRHIRAGNEKDYNLRSRAPNEKFFTLAGEVKRDNRRL